MNITHDVNNISPLDGANYLSDMESVQNSDQTFEYMYHNTAPYTDDGKIYIDDHHVSPSIVLSIFIDSYL